MFESKLCIRVVNWRYVRVIGASTQDISRGFSHIKMRWENKAVVLGISSHSEYKEWYHVTFNTEGMNPEEIKARAILIRDDLKRFFQALA